MRKKYADIINEIVPDRIIESALKTTNKHEDNWQQGDLNITFSRLIELFGPPNGPSGDKVQDEWMLEAEDGSLVTIHDWKTPEGENIEEVEYWTIGGSGDTQAVQEALNLR